MKNNKLWLAIGFSILLAGCAANRFPFQTTQTVSPEGLTNTTIELAPLVSNAFATAQQVNRDFTPQPFTGVVDIALGALSAFLGWFARKQTLELSRQREAADLLAATIVQQKAQVAALQAASGTKAVSAVAQHIDNNTL